jgi:cyclase
MSKVVRVTRRQLLRMGSSAAPAMWLAGMGAAQTQQPELHVEKLAGKLTLLTGTGGNIAILEGEEGTLLVDSGLPNTVEAFENKLRSGGLLPVKVLINTHYHYDHVGANDRFGSEGARIIAHENVLKRLRAQQADASSTAPPRTPKGLPTLTYSESGNLTYGGVKVAYEHLPPAHTDGDTTVRFESLNVYHAGDLFFNGMYPYIDYAAGGSIEGMVAAADRMIEAVDAKTQVIPGHGPMATREDLRTFRSVLAEANERVSKLIAEGKTLEQVLAAEPLKSIDAKWYKAGFGSARFLRVLYAGKTGARK